MRSKWFELKGDAVALREEGISITVIEKKLGIPRSTLSGWFKDVELSEEKRTKLMKSKQDGWLKAREKAAEWHRAQKALRLIHAEKEALRTLGNIDITDEILDLALAMLYFGEGAKTNVTSIASSNPVILRFVLTVLRRNYSVTPNMIRCDLHLRMDQDSEKLKKYWSNALNIPIKQFKYVAFDKRSEGKTTYNHYRGVCVITCHRVAIQRKLIYLYRQFCDKVSSIDEGM